MKLNIHVSLPFKLRKKMYLPNRISIGSQILKYFYGFTYNYLEHY